MTTRTATTDAGDVKQPRSVRIAGLLLLVFALLATACGSNDDDVAADDAATGDSVAADDATAGDSAGQEQQANSEDPAELVPVRVAPPNYIISALPAFYAVAEGYFEDEGVDLEMMEPTGSSTIGIQLVRSGDAELAMVGGSALFAAAESGVDLVGTGSVANRTSLQLILNEAAAAELEAAGVTADSPIEDRVNALAGMTIAVGAEGTGTNTFLRGTLQEFGLDPDSDVTIQPVPDAGAVVTAAREGHADGFVWAPPETSLPVVEGWGTQWIKYSDGEVPGYGGDLGLPLVGMRDWITEHTDANTGTWRALVRAQEELSQEELPDLSGVKSMFFDELDEDVFLQAVRDVQGMWTGAEPAPELFTATVEVYNSTAEEPTDLTVDELFVLEPLEAAKS